MKSIRLHNASLLLPLVALLATLPGCRIAGDIFKAGFGVGIVAVLFLVAIVAGVAALVRRA